MGSKLTEKTEPRDYGMETQLPMNHLNERGEARMVDVSAKRETLREARARAVVIVSDPVAAALQDNTVPKGDAMAVARIAGIQAVKRTPDLLPLAHPIGIDHVALDITQDRNRILLESTVKCVERTGVEMEALTAVTVGALALVDMLKGVDRGITLSEAYVTYKAGGRSGVWERES